MQRIVMRWGVVFGASGLLACDKTTEPEPVPPPVVPVLRVSPASARLTSAGDSVQLSASVEPSASAPAGYTWIVRDTLVARVTQQGLLRAIGAGTTRVLAFGPAGARDSMTLRVEPVLARIDLAAGSSTGDRNTFVYRALFRDAGDAVMSVDTTRIIWASRDGLRPTRVLHYAGGSEATFVGTTPGTDSITVTLDAIRASAPLVTTPPPRLAFSFDSLVLGVETTPIDGPVVTSPDGPSPFGAYTLTVADPSIATVVPGPERVNIVGRRTGRTTLRAQSPGFSPITVPLVVGGQRWVGFEKRVDTPVGSRNYCRSATLQSDNGSFLRTLRTLRYEARVADNRVVLINAGSETGTLTPGSYFWGFCAVTGNPGASTALITVVDGFAPETTVVTLSSGRVDFIDFGLRNGVREVRGAAGASYQVLMIPDRFPATGGVVRFTHSNPAVASVADSVVFQVSDLQVPKPFFYQLLAPGVDTVVASGPGLRGDTLIFIVEPVKLLATGAGVQVFEGIDTRIYVLPTAGAPFTGRIPASVRSTDPSVLEVLSPEIVVSSQSFQAPDIAVRPLRPGTARLVITPRDPTAVTTTGEPIVVQPNPIRLLDKRRITLGQRQVTGGPNVFVAAASPTIPIRIRSTDSAVARAHIATIPPSTQSAQLNILAGDKTGTAWIVAERTGLPADSVEVRVGKPKLVPEARSLGGPDRRWAVTVSLRDYLGNLRRAGEPFTLQFTSSDTARVVVEPATLSVDLNGQQALGDVTVRYVTRDSAAGRDTVFITVQDPRSVPYRYDSGVIQLEYRRIVGQSGRVVEDVGVTILDRGVHEPTGVSQGQVREPPTSQRIGRVPPTPASRTETKQKPPKRD